MRKLLYILLLVSPVLNLRAQTDLEPEEIIKRFAAKEAEFREVFQQYTYTQRILFQVLSRSGAVREEQQLWVEVFFTSDGKRETRTIRERGELRSVRVSPEDIDDAIYRQPFVLTTDELPNYKIKYKGEELVDALDTYVFDVEPRKIEDGERYFEGASGWIIWIFRS